MQNKKILIAKIISVFGVKGQVKIISYFQQPLDIEKYKVFDIAGNFYEIKIDNDNKEYLAANKGQKEVVFIATINNINNRDDAYKLKNLELFIARESLPIVNDGEYYISDLKNLTVIDNITKKNIGIIRNIYDFGAGAVLEVAFNDEFIENNKHKFEKIENFPFKNHFFPKVDIANSIIEIELPEIIIK